MQRRSDKKADTVIAQEPPLCGKPRLRHASGIIYVTGTDTGVGKTLLTGFLLSYLRSTGVNALGMKPLCSGGREDAIILNSLQDNALTIEDMNPWHFITPVTPLVAARKEGQKVVLEEVKNGILGLKKRCEVLLVEGAGGILSPLGDNFCLADLARETGGAVIIAARNRLGVINSARLTGHYLQSTGVEHYTIVLMGGIKADVSVDSNEIILKEVMPEASIFRVAELGKEEVLEGGIKKCDKKMSKTLAQIFGSCRLSSVDGD